jgi:hypothetical protein
MVVSYKLSSFHASRRWLKAVLAKCIEALTDKNYGVQDQFTDKVMHNLWLIANKEKFRKDRFEDEVAEFKRRRLQHSLKLLLTGKKEMEFTPLQFEDVISFGKHCLAIPKPKLNSYITPQSAQEIIYFFNPRSADRELI